MKDNFVSGFKWTAMMLGIAFVAVLWTAGLMAPVYFIKPWGEANLPEVVRLALLLVWIIAYVSFSVGFAIGRED